MNDRSKKALTNLMDELAQHDRATGRRYTVIIIPEQLNEEIQVHHSSSRLPPNVLLEDAINLTMMQREQNIK